MASSSCVFIWWKRRGSSFITTLNSLMRALLLGPKHFPNAPPPNTIILGIHCHYMNFGGAQARLKVWFLFLSSILCVLRQEQDWEPWKNIILIYITRVLHKYFQASNTLHIHLILDSKWTFDGDAEKKNVNRIGIPLLLPWWALAVEIFLANKKLNLFSAYQSRWY